MPNYNELAYKNYKYSEELKQEARELISQAKQLGLAAADGQKYAEHQAQFSDEIKDPKARENAYLYAYESAKAYDQQHAKAQELRKQAEQLEEQSKYHDQIAKDYEELGRQESDIEGRPNYKSY